MRLSPEESSDNERKSSRKKWLAAGIGAAALGIVTIEAAEQSGSDPVLGLILGAVIAAGTFRWISSSRGEGTR